MVNSRKSRLPVLHIHTVEQQLFHDRRHLEHSEEILKERVQE